MAMYSTTNAGGWATITDMTTTSSTYSGTNITRQMYNDALNDASYQLARAHNRYIDSSSCTTNPHAGKLIAVGAVDGMAIAGSFVGEIELPDGAKMKFDRGKYEIIDRDAKITYKANRYREFNRYVNSSDLIEEFVGYLGSLGLTQREVLGIPMEVFVLWLVVRAAEADGEDTPEEAQQLVLTVKMAAKPRCRHCGRFVTRRRQKIGVLFCNDAHVEAHAYASSP